MDLYIRILEYGILMDLLKIINFILVIDNLIWIIHESRLLQRQGSGPRSCSELPRVSYNEDFVVRSARL